MREARKGRCELCEVTERFCAFWTSDALLPPARSLGRRGNLFQRRSAGPRAGARNALVRFYGWENVLSLPTGESWREGQQSVNSPPARYPHEPSHKPSARPRFRSPSKPRELQP